MEITVVCSVYNEAASLNEHYNVLKQELSARFNKYEIIYVDDGSTDKSRFILDEIAARDTTVKVISFSKNFGHEAAMTAGIDNSLGDAVICMDSDLQHPPSVISSMYEAFKEGADVVSAIRLTTKKQGFVRKQVTKLFYYLLSKVSTLKVQPNASDFFLISKRVATILKKDYREHNRFTRVIIQNIGFKSARVNYIANERFAGESKYPFNKLLSLSVTAVIATSNLPLRLGIVAGILFGIFSLLLSIYSIVMKFYGNPFTGYTTLIVFISFAFSLQFIIIGVIGEYLGYLYMETKKRQLYIIDKIIQSKNE